MGDIDADCNISMKLEEALQADEPISCLLDSRDEAYSWLTGDILHKENIGTATSGALNRQALVSEPDTKSLETKRILFKGSNSVPGIKRNREIYKYQMARVPNSAPKKMRYMDEDSGSLTNEPFGSVRPSAVPPITETVSKAALTSSQSSETSPNFAVSGIELAFGSQDSYRPARGLDSPMSGGSSGDLEGTFLDVTYYKEVSLGLDDPDSYVPNADEIAAPHPLSSLKSKTSWREPIHAEDSDNESEDIEPDHMKLSFCGGADPRIDEVILGLQQFFIASEKKDRKVEAVGKRPDYLVRRSIDFEAEIIDEDAKDYMGQAESKILPVHSVGLESDSLIGSSVDSHPESGLSRASLEERFDEICSTENDDVHSGNTDKANMSVREKAEIPVFDIHAWMAQGEIETADRLVETEADQFFSSSTKTGHRLTIQEVEADSVCPVSKESSADTICNQSEAVDFEVANSSGCDLSKIFTSTPMLEKKLPMRGELPCDPNNEDNATMFTCFGFVDTVSYSAPANSNAFQLDTSCLGPVEATSDATAWFTCLEEWCSSKESALDIEVSINKGSAKENDHGLTKMAVAPNNPLLSDFSQLELPICSETTRKLLLDDDTAQDLGRGNSAQSRLFSCSSRDSAHSRLILDLNDSSRSQLISGNMDNQLFNLGFESRLLHNVSSFPKQELMNNKSSVPQLDPEDGSNYLQGSTNARCKLLLDDNPVHKLDLNDSTPSKMISGRNLQEKNKSRSRPLLSSISVPELDLNDSTDSQMISGSHLQDSSRSKLLINDSPVQELDLNDSTPSQLIPCRHLQDRNNSRSRPLLSNISFSELDLNDSTPSPIFTENLDLQASHRARSRLLPRSSSVKQLDSDYDSSKSRYPDSVMRQKLILADGTRSKLLPDEIAFPQLDQDDIVFGHQDDSERLELECCFDSSSSRTEARSINIGIATACANSILATDEDGEICSVPDNPDNTADEISGPATQSLSEAVVQVVATGVLFGAIFVLGNYIKHI